MSRMPPADQRFGTGPLARAAALVYTLLTVEACVLLATAPGLAGLTLLGPGPGNLPLAALCALPAGPALAAAVYAMDRRRPDLTDLHPAAAFRRGYRACWRPATLVWAAVLVWLTVLSVNLALLPAVLPGWWALPLAAVALVVALCGLNALVVVALFAFRLRDVGRLAWWSLGHAPATTAGNTGLLAVALCVTLAWSEAALLAMASVFAWALRVTAAPMIAAIRTDFTR
ncbi:DUF624 domain-containing protein [Mangrovihabitans endophyticus]|uniref:DUF624 domain-containing protein n=1 Tax=Mangrovihabitans endophyticus TaxID=1751298 RepID=A0A8J3FQE9_9ACTN|nr:DUF624 domain-containing protein [Mangrovihabitans endophyticus]GGL00368.1 hypothetical protein GCM10012284_38480 [Mangrovihabitans endophyticus]